ncbi:PP2C family protein-serine/threonine phosphatase [Ruania halotolerans]|uniref:PP2C family protein-serine/threonine phosphatase n=1 Tax=Ruania halotolerans TaxID=2897773 RepID=UPI001E36BF4E|nr:protein phosphatase 2C domain-containing protein [Ruania halotolerans]UFU06380.1 protein phosphatase 2C domain-containing protein [Ruania halotolerans]
MAVRFRYALSTDLGTVRTNNEDSAFGSDRLLLLADGMGGHAAGEVASATAMRVFAGLTTQLVAGVTAADAILDAGRRTRRALHSMSEADPMLESMGTTLLAAACDGDGVTVGHIGDSRVYALREESLYQVTTDHTHVQRLVETGQLTPERARTHPYRSMLVKSLDDQPGGADLDIIDVQLQVGDRLLLCSDGLSDYLPAEQIGELLAVPDLEEAAQRLVDAALEIGTRDNVTVVVADLEVLESTASTTTASTRHDPDGGASVVDQGSTVVGAAGDAIGLSAEAAAALRATLPDLVLDAQAPMAGLADAPAASLEDDEAPDDQPHTPPGVPPAEGETAAAPAPSGSSSGPGQTHPSATPHRLPGLLAALAVLAVAVALWLLLG